MRALTCKRRMRIVDVACGNGAVTRVAIGIAQSAGVQLDMHCVDCSSGAVGELQKQYPSVTALVCNALQLPYSDKSFDLVVSQFGIEYAGEAAFLEAARLVATGGALVAIAHSTDSALHRECAENLATVRAVGQSNLMASTRDAFVLGFKLLDRKASAAEFQVRDRQLAAAVETTKRILRSRGTGALHAFLESFVRDVGYMYNRIANYTPAKVFAWLDLMERELIAYEGRMASMTRSALDETAFKRIAGFLSSEGLMVDPSDTLSLRGSGKPAGWILCARRAEKGPCRD